MKYPDDYIDKVVCGDCLEVMKGIPDGAVDCVVTSPPYWGLRDYGVDGQLGLEKTFEEYVNKLCTLFDEVKRVLKDTGTVWVNIGDTYCSHSIGSGNVGLIPHYAHTIQAMAQKKQSTRFGKDGKISKGLSGRGRGATMPDKCLLLIPFRFALEMCNRGWILRNTLIWYKPNCMPSSVKDRFTVDFEYIFFFVKSKKYWFEQQFEEHQSIGQTGWEKSGRGDGSKTIMRGNGKVYPMFGELGRNARAVWRIHTQPYPEAHFAVYPEALIETPIKAGCPQYICKKCGVAREKIYTSAIGSGKVNSNTFTGCGCNAGFRPGIVLDPFMGSGTTAVVARKLGRDFIGIELNEEYIKLARKRLMGTPDSLFKEQA